MTSDRYEAIDPITGLPMCFEAYVPKDHLMQRLAADNVRETEDGLFYRTDADYWVYVPREIPPPQASDDRRAAAFTDESRQGYLDF